MAIEEYPFTNDNGNQHWLKDGRYHHEDGPAFETPAGSREWWVNGLRHRTDGPAIMLVEEEWWINEPLHGWWWINGEDMTHEVEKWMRLKQISWPWDEATQVEFLLTWT